MKIGVLGTGMVGKAIGTRLAGLGHEVCMGSRSADNPEAAGWAGETRAGASHGTFADAAAFGEVLFNCTGGMVSLDALAAAGEDNLAGKVLVDVSNALDFSQGSPPTLAVCNTDSVGERIQRRFPSARVVKSLNTMNNAVMVDPTRVPGRHNVFLSGDDPDAKALVADLLRSFGWPGEDIVDLGAIDTARGPEMYVAFWVRLYPTVGGAPFNIAVVH
jgi:predicted dinucleotide-binding enzyme